MTADGFTLLKESTICFLLPITILLRSTGKKFHPLLSPLIFAKRIGKGVNIGSGSEFLTKTSVYMTQDLLFFSEVLSFLVLKLLKKLVQLPKS